MGKKAKRNPRITASRESHRLQDLANQVHSYTLDVLDENVSENEELVEEVFFAITELQSALGKVKNALEKYIDEERTVTFRQMIDRSMNVEADSE